MGNLKKLLTVLLIITVSLTLTSCGKQTENDKEIKSRLEQYKPIESLEDVTALQQTNIELYQSLKNKEADSQSLEKKRIKLLDNLYSDNQLIDSLLVIKAYEETDYPKPSVELVSEIINLENVDRLDKAKTLLDLEKYSTPDYINSALNTAARYQIRLTSDFDNIKSLAAELVIKAYENVEKPGPVSESIADTLIEWSKALESNIKEGDTKIKEAGMNFVELFESKTGNTAIESDKSKYVDGGLTNSIEKQEFEYQVSVDNTTRMEYISSQISAAVADNYVSFNYTSKNLSEKVGSEIRSIHDGGIQSAIMHYDGKTYDIKESEVFNLLEVLESTVTISISAETTDYYDSDTLIEFLNSSDSTKSIEITFKDNKKITIPSELFSNEIGKSASDYAATILTYNK